MKFAFFAPLGALIAVVLTFSSVLSANSNRPKQPLFLYAYVHEDIPIETRGTLRKDYFAWMLKDLESTTGRRVYLELIENEPGLTDFSYSGPDAGQTLNTWTKVISTHIFKQNLPSNMRTKYILLTQDRLNSETVGIAGVRHYAAIASLDTYIAPAHEIGHMFNANHEQSETLFINGWPCGTNMTKVKNSNILRSNCYVYSDKNKQAIAAHLSEFD